MRAGSDTRQQGYISVPSETVFSFEQGRAYWLITSERITLDTGPNEGLSTPTNGAYRVTLAPGWNLVGNPFLFPVVWDSCFVDTLIMAEAESILVEPPVAWSTSGIYRFDSRILEPFDGYWVRNLDTLSHVLGVHPKEASYGRSGNPPPPAAAPANDTGPGTYDWLVEIVASCGETMDRGNVVGVTRGADAGWDKRDRSEPPMSPGKAISLYFPHQSWGLRRGCYTSDIRGAYVELDGGMTGGHLFENSAWGHSWYFDVAKSFSNEPAGDEVLLELDGMENVPALVNIYLIDRKLARVIDPRETKEQYRFTQGERFVSVSECDARFVLVVGSEEFLEKHKYLLPGPPEKTALYQNYPNPFNPATVIRYDLAAAAKIDLRVYDVTGALVRVLEDTRRGPGRYEASWDGRDDNGTPVSSGVYFYRLTAGYSVMTRKMLLLK